MKLRSIALAAIAAASFGAQAAPLTTYAPWDAAYPGIAGVMFNVASASSVTLALGAHAYKNGVSLPNNGTNTFYAQSGTYAPDGLNRANWSFDFFVSGSGATCNGCTVSLLVDTDPTASSTLVQLFKLPVNTGNDSWNMEMNFGAGGFAGLPGNLLQNTYNFNPFAASSTAFALELNDASGNELVRSDITVNVPEPGSLALVGLSLARLAVLRRRKV